MSDLLGRLGQRAIGEQPEAAPAGASRAATDETFTEVVSREDQPPSDEPPRRPRRTGEPAYTGEAAPIRKARRDETSVDTVAPKPRHRYSQSTTVPETRVATRRPAPAAHDAERRKPAIEPQEKPAPIVPRVVSTVGGPGDDEVAAGRATTSDVEPKTGEPVVRPRVEKTLALEAASASATGRGQSDYVGDEADETIVNVHIGRIEVRAPQAPQPASQPQQQRPKAPSPSLASYLAARSRGRG
jgi:hypothetical protein